MAKINITRNSKKSVTIMESNSKKSEFSASNRKKSVTIES